MITPAPLTVHPALSALALEADLDVPPANRDALQLIVLAQEAGLKATLRAPYGSSYKIVLDALDGPDSAFGSITLGRKSGRVLRGTFARGNDQRPVDLAGARAVRAALKQYAAEHVSVPGASASAHPAARLRTGNQR